MPFGDSSYIQASRRFFQTRYPEHYSVHNFFPGQSKSPFVPKHFEADVKPQFLGSIVATTEIIAAHGANRNFD